MTQKTGGAQLRASHHIGGMIAHAGEELSEYITPED